jgi:hypothetical protein
MHQDLKRILLTIVDRRYYINNNKTHGVEAQRYYQLLMALLLCFCRPVGPADYAEH